MTIDPVRKEDVSKIVAHSDYRHDEVLDIGVKEFRLYSRKLQVLGWYSKKKERIIVREWDKENQLFKKATKVYSFPIRVFHDEEYEVLKVPIANQQVKLFGSTLTISAEDKALMEAQKAKMIHNACVNPVCKGYQGKLKKEKECPYCKSKLYKKK